MTDQNPERIEVSRAIAAEPAAIFAVLRDPNGHVAIDASGMLMWASGSAASAAGDTFVIHMDRDALRDMDLGEYQVTVIFVTYEQDREIAWTVGRNADERFGHVYGYRLDPIPDGTLVTQYYDWSQINGPLKERFPIIPESALRATLGILARTVAPGADRPGAKPAPADA
jgi:Polyketide cyclase / dehydrase and lipid transport